MKVRNLGWIFWAAFVVASCSDRAQEMEEKVTQMQRQLDETQKQLQAANQALASRAPVQAEQASSASAASSGLPSREAVEQSYTTSVNAFRKELDANLKNFRVESCTTHSVQMPAEFYPFTSQLSLAFVSTEGKNFTTDIPVKADVTGKWIFPTVAEVTQRIASVEHATSGTTASAATTQKTSGTGEPAPYMKVNGTFVIQWPDAKPNGSATAARTTAPAENQPQAVSSTPVPPPVPQPSAQNAGAAPVMPVDRDVKIQFPSPP
jgi:hypothetical protein